MEGKSTWGAKGSHLERIKRVVHAIPWLSHHESSFSANLTDQTYITPGLQGKDNRRHGCEGARSQDFIQPLLRWAQQNWHKNSLVSESAVEPALQLQLFVWEYNRSFQSPKRSPWHNLIAAVSLRESCFPEPLAVYRQCCMFVCSQCAHVNARTLFWKCKSCPVSFLDLNGKMSSYEVCTVFWRPALRLIWRKLRVCAQSSSR